MKRLEFNFFQSFAPEEMLRRLKEPIFNEVQKSTLIIHGGFNGTDVEVSIGFLINQYQKERTEYDTFIVKNAHEAQDVLDSLIEYIDENIEDLVLLLKLQ